MLSVFVLRAVWRLLQRSGAGASSRLKRLQACAVCSRYRQAVRPKTTLKQCFPKHALTRPPPRVAGGGNSLAAARVRVALKAEGHRRPAPRLLDCHRDVAACQVDDGGRGAGGGRV